MARPSPPCTRNFREEPLGNFPRNNWKRGGSKTTKGIKKKKHRGKKQEKRRRRIPQCWKRYKGNPKIRLRRQRGIKSPLTLVKNLWTYEINNPV